MSPRLCSGAPTGSPVYPGLTHSVHGESESGKSLIVQAECARLVNAGQRVLYLDFESDQQSVLDRLRQR